MAESQLSITFTNLSSTELYLDSNHHHLQKGGNSLKQWPGNNSILIPGSGTAKCVVTQNLSTFEAMPCEFYCCWRDAQNNRFGIKIYTHPQVAMIGPGPEWQVSDSGTEVHWIDNGSDPANSYYSKNYGEESEQHAIPYRWLAIPTSTHQSLGIEVTITNFPKSPTAP